MSPVYLLVITGGTFTDKSAIMAPGGTVPSGPVQAAIVMPSNWSVSGFGVGGPGHPNLSSLGTPETDSLSGLRPMTQAQFQAKYPS